MLRHLVKATFDNRVGVTLRNIFFLLAAIAIASCGQRREEKIVTPWGEVADTVPKNDHFDLDNIVANGELIMLTVSGPDTYYDYHGHPMGAHYMLCQRFADKTGVSLRVEVCRDTTEMVRRLIGGDGDIVACKLDKKQINISKDSLQMLTACGANNDSAAINWLVSNDKPALAKAIDSWYKPTMLADVRREEQFLLSTQSVKRHVYAPMLNRKGGVISRYDALFVAYSHPIRWDWKLMAAQCYQESTFDPQAKSWAGACGLMQIMPSTAAEIGLPIDKIHDPESNIAAAAKYIALLDGRFADITDRRERINFILASYNGGYHHIRDAMALTAKNGKDQHRWAEVSRYVLHLSEPRYYRDATVKHGYMRGSETVDYVYKIQQRWLSYRGVKTPHVGFSGMTPQKAKRSKKKYKI